MSFDHLKKNFHKLVGAARSNRIRQFKNAAMPPERPGGPGGAQDAEGQNPSQDLPALMAMLPPGINNEALPGPTGMPPSGAGFSKKGR